MWFRRNSFCKITGKKRVDYNFIIPNALHSKKKKFLANKKDKSNEAFSQFTLRINEEIAIKVLKVLKVRPRKSRRS